VRGGALPLFAWAALLAVLLAINWIWTGDAIQVGSFGFAVLAVVASGIALTLARRDAIRPGAPDLPDEAEAVPEASLGAALAGLSVATIAFGLAFGRFLVDFGTATLLASLGRVAVEMRSERRSRDALREESNR
jgi:hypothetical protein